MNDDARRRDTVVRGAIGILTGRSGPAERTYGDIRIRDGRIAHIGTVASEPNQITIDARDCVIYPGLVNTHHHLFQSLLKGVGAGLGLALEGWVHEVLFRYWDRVDEAALELAATIGVAELLLSGVTTVADHHFLFSDADGYDAAGVLFDVAQRLGVRLVLCRGGATRGGATTAPGLRATPTESLAGMIRRVGELAARYNDRAPDAMRRVVFAPSTPPWAVEPDELTAIAEAARGMGIMLHSHLSETTSYATYTLERYGLRPVPWVGQHGWLGADVWYAHLVDIDDAELALLASTGTGMAHCAQSNCRLGAGIAPAARFAALGGRVSLAVDGAASNECADMLSEMHVAWLVQRARYGSGAVRAEDIVRWASAGGAEVLGLPALGTIEIGKAADLAVFALDDVRSAGLHDPLIGPVIGAAGRARSVLVAGRPVVIDGVIPGLDVARLRAQAAQTVAKWRNA